MSDLRTAAKQALEALEGEQPGWRTPAQERAIVALRDALAQEDEPVAWAQLTVREIEECFRDANDDHIIAARNVELMVEKKNAASPQRKPLMDEEIKNIYVSKHWYEIGEFTWGAAKVVARAIERAHGIGGDV